METSRPSSFLDRRVAVEERGEVCLAEEAERLRRSGMGTNDIARRMGVDVSWVETVVVAPGEDEDPERN